MNILLAGGAGFLGKNFARYWRRTRSASSIVVLDTLRRHRSDIALLEGMGNTRVVGGDVKDVNLVERMLRRDAIDMIVNFACNANVGRAADNPQSVVESNVASTISLLEAARRVGDVRLHHVSSAEVFSGLPCYVLVHEDAPYAPRTAYGASKASADHFVRIYHGCYGVPTTISIAPNTYGPYQPTNQVLARFITHAIRGMRLPIYGDGSCSHEWLHVEDHCAGIGAILDHGRAGRTYNLGSGEHLNIRELAAAVLCSVGRPASFVRQIPDRPTRSNRPALNRERARDEVGWRASIPLNTGVVDTTNWYVANERWWMSAAGAPNVGVPATGESEERRFKGSG